ncbi:MAG: ankyrin repeat domain-containing protein [Capsulimonadaceae bacterium]|nr:ankyrin repeat domain-containing protein [Capsulimonadaceae bacterium]
MDVMISNYRSIECLLDAACAGDTREVKRLLKQGIDPDTQDENGFPVLALAAVGGHASTVKALLESGANIEATDSEGNTALRWAADEGHLDVAQVLLERGAQIDIVNNDGYSPTYCALSSRRFRMVELLRAHTAVRQTLVKA